MSEIMAAVLIVSGPVLALVCVVGVFALAGLVAYDVAFSHASAPAVSKAESQARSRSRKQEGAETRMYIERGVARGFVILGASFWGICAAAAALWYQRGAETLLLIALIPFLMNLACLVIGWRWERTASLMLTLTSVGAIWWGIAAGFEPGVWMLVVLLLVGPMMTAAVLFWLARQGEIELELRLAVPQELAPVRIEH